MGDTKVFSEYPVIIQHVSAKPSTGSFSSMDGSASPREVLAFQKWVNKFKFKEKKIVEDGKWSPKTKAAWDEFGSDYAAGASAVSNVYNKFQEQSGGSTTTTPKLGFFDKLKGGLDKALGFKTKAEELAGKANELRGKIKTGPNGEVIDATVDYSSDDDSAKKAKTKKIIIWSAVGLTTIAIIYFATRSTGKAKA